MATKRIEIIYDVNGKAIDLAVDSTLNLKRQVVELTKLLRTLPEGTDAFKLVAQRLGDAEDALTKTTAKSKDLFSSLSMLPGPVGQFFSQLQGGIELLKTFSSFTFKDLQFQFKQTADDIKDIGDNIAGAKKEAAAPIGGAGAAGAGAGGGISSAASTAAGVAGAAAKTTQEAALNVGKAIKEMGIQLTSKEAAMVKFAALNKNLALSSNVATRQIELQTVATEKAAFATTTLGKAIKGALIASGIGIAIVLITELVMMLWKMVSAEEAAAKATEKLNKELESQNLLLDLDAKSAKRRNDEIIALMKSQGKSESEIRKVTLKNSYDDYTRAYDAEVKAREIYNANLGKVDAEGLKAMEKNLLDREQATKDAYSAYKVLGLNQKAEELKTQEQKNEQLRQKNQQYLEKVKADNKSADDTLIALKRENAALSITDERKRQEKELENQKAAEEDKIKELKISKEKEGLLLTQIATKYELKLADLKAKFKKEDEDKEKERQQKVTEAQQKLIDIELDQYEAGVQKEKLLREEKYNDDLIELKKLYADKLISQDEYQVAVINLNQALVNDLKKIDDDKKKKDKEDRLKKLDDEIRFQEISNEANKNSFVAYWKGRKTLLDLAKQRELEAEELTGAQKAAIEKKYVQLSKDLQREKFEAYVGYLNQGLGAVSNVLNQELAVRNLKQQAELDDLQLAFNKQQEYNSKTMSSKEEYDKQTIKNEKELAKQQDAVKEKYFNRNKDAQYAQALIAASQAAISAYASLAVIPVVGPALGIAAAAVALGYGIKQANLIKAQKYVSGITPQGPDESTAGSGNMGKNYGEGGMIEGPRHAGGGVMINAEGGEAVMTRGAVTMFAPLLSAMNQMGGGTSFTRGAAGQAGYDNPKTTETITQPQIVKTYVVSSELTTEAQKQARLKDLSIL